VPRKLSHQKFNVPTECGDLRQGGGVSRLNPEASTLRVSLRETTSQKVGVDAEDLGTSKCQSHGDAPVTSSPNQGVIAELMRKQLEKERETVAQMCGFLGEIERSLQVAIRTQALDRHAIAQVDGLVVLWSDPSCERGHRVYAMTDALRHRMPPSGISRSDALEYRT
jgi:hypothetical protein